MKPRKPRRTVKHRAPPKRGAGRRAPKKKPAPPVQLGAPAENPRAQALARQIAALALDKKALDVLILDARGITSYADYFIIASGESERQVSATAEHIREQLKAGGVTPIGFEGFETGQWVLLDYGEVVVHLLYSEARTFYDLEGLWSDAPRERVA